MLNKNKVKKHYLEREPKLYGNPLIFKLIANGKTEEIPVKELKILLNEPVNSKKRTVLQWIFRQCEVLKINKTLLNRTNLTKLNIEGENCFHEAARRCNLWFIPKRLIKREDLILENCVGETPLYLATQNLILNQIESKKIKGIDLLKECRESGTCALEEILSIKAKNLTKGEKENLEEIYKTYLTGKKFRGLSKRLKTLDYVDTSFRQLDKVKLFSLIKETEKLEELKKEKGIEVE